MRNTITLNGVESSTIPGLLIQSLAPISKPLMRTEVETIDGRDGDITTNLGFSAYDKQITIGLFGEFDINQVIAYFNSKGTVVFSNEPDKFYNYEIVEQIDFERLVRYRTATVTMHCQPFKYSTTEGADILSTNDNFATLNQSLNTDSGFYTYSSNVQDDITATRSGGTGGKFFAVFSVPVVQGVTYYFSGNGSKNISMYGYTNQLRGTSAGISGKGFTGYFTYTATFTGTMVLGFYSNISTEIFIRNFKISNQSAATVSGEGTNIVLENSAEAPFGRFDLKGNTEQTTYSGKNLCGIPDQTFTHQGVTVTIKDGEVTMNGTSIGTGTKSISPIKTTTLNGSYTTNLIYVSGTAGQGNFNLRKASDSSVIQGTQTSYYSNNTSVSYSITNTDIQFGFYILSTGTVFSNYKFKIQIVAGSTPDYDFEQFVGGTASPNPDYPQAVKVVTGENVVKITGKNLFDCSGYNQSSAGLTNTLNSDGTITTTGIPTGNYARIVPNLYITDLLEDGATYTVSKTYSANHVGVQVQAGKVEGGTNFYNGTFTVDKSTHTYYLITAQTTTMEGWGSEPRTITCGYQLEKGTTATNFEPYQGQSYEVNLGKNLYEWDGVAWTSSSTTTSWCFQDGATSAYGANITDKTNYKLTLSAGTYKISVTDRSSNILTIQAVKNGSSNEVVINDPADVTAATPSTITLTETTTFCVRYRVTNPSLGIGNAKIQIEKGSQATSYAAYFEPIELCKIGDYQDYLYKSGDKWYKHKAIGKYVYNNDLSTNGISATRVSMITPVVDMQAATTSLDGKAVCNMYESTMSGPTGLNGTTSASRIRVETSTAFASSYDEVKALAAANNLTIHYALATPTDTEITNEALKAQLDAISQANAYRQRTHINALAATGNVPHIIAAEVATDPSGTITNSGNIYSKPKLTIFGSGSVGVYLNGVQMFQIALDTNDYITIDTALMEAYKDNLQTLKNRSVTGDYNNFKLPVGDSEISFSGTVTMCVVENYSRWL